MKKVLDSLNNLRVAEDGAGIAIDVSAVDGEEITLGLPVSLINDLLVSLSAALTICGKIKSGNQEAKHLYICDSIALKRRGEISDLGDGWIFVCKLINGIEISFILSLDAFKSFTSGISQILDSETSDIIYID